MSTTAAPVRHAGNADLWLAAWVSARSAQGGVPLHLHAEGPRGTGKTTVLRTFVGLLPPIRRIAGCPYNCDPHAPHCPLHKGLTAGDVEALGTESVPPPFHELSASAKLPTAVGTIDLQRLLDREHPEAAVLPGSIARAHRGVLFVDEINRLADVAPELTDALLDVMGTKPGRLQIEEAGMPVVHMPVAVTVWAASNPDEEPGPLEQTRLQLADRFDLRISVEPPSDAGAVLAVLAPDRAGPAHRPADEPGLQGPARLPPWPQALLQDMAAFYLRSGLHSLRALAAWRRTAEVLAERRGADSVEHCDVALAARLTLRGRGALDSELTAPPAPLRAEPESAFREAPRAQPRSSVSVAARRDVDGEPQAQAAAAAAGGGAPRPSEEDRPSPLSEVRPPFQPEWTGDTEG